MNSVHSEELGVTITGNMITRHNVPHNHLGILGAIYGQISATYVGDETFEVSAPMNEADHHTFAGLIHRLNSENKLKEKVDTKGKGPENDPTPPSGGTPGAARQTWYDHIMAMGKAA